MTRLRADDICNVNAELMDYNQQLVHTVGKSLAEIAVHSLNKKLEDFAGRYDLYTVGVIPVSCGEGIISGFSLTVQKIVEFLGFRSFVTEDKDVGGLAEAVRKGANIIFLADDDNFVAINIVSGKVSDNGEATGRGYAAALDLMAGGLNKRTVLLIGAGPVGTGAATFMTGRGARVLVYDIDGDKVEKLRQALPEAEAASELNEALVQARLIIEATPAADIIDQKYIFQDTMIAAPGIPLGLNRECKNIIGGRLVHDVLEIGVASMLFAVLDE